jgi:hypothetical protein
MKRKRDFALQWRPTEGTIKASAECACGEIATVPRG